jgi:hypothetical protein
MKISWSKFAYLVVGCLITLIYCYHTRLNFDHFHSDFSSASIESEFKLDSVEIMDYSYYRIVNPLNLDTILFTHSDSYYYRSGRMYTIISGPPDGLNMLPDGKFVMDFYPSYNGAEYGIGKQFVVTDTYEHRITFESGNYFDYLCEEDTVITVTDSSRPYSYGRRPTVLWIYYSFYDGKLHIENDRIKKDFYIDLKGEE